MDKEIQNIEVMPEEAPATEGVVESAATAEQASERKPSK